MTLRIIALFLLMFSLQLSAAEVILDFDSPKQEQRYKSLIDELRCMVCQNQNLADSNAELAEDLRDRTYDMIRTGASDDEIIDYMVERYGDFVLYRPPVKTSTLLLWYGPALLLLIAVYAVWRHTRRKSQLSPTQISDSQRKKIRQLLDK